MMIAKPSTDTKTPNRDTHEYLFFKNAHENKTTNGQVAPKRICTDKPEAADFTKAITAKKIAAKSNTDVITIFP